MSALVKKILVNLAGEESESERLKSEERALRAQIHSFSAGDRLSRDEVHDRK